MLLSLFVQAADVSSELGREARDLGPESKIERLGLPRSGIFIITSLA